MDSTDSRSGSAIGWCAAAKRQMAGNRAALNSRTALDYPETLCGLRPFRQRLVHLDNGEHRFPGTGISNSFGFGSCFLDSVLPEGVGVPTGACVCLLHGERMPPAACQLLLLLSNGR